MNTTPMRAGLFEPPSPRHPSPLPEPTAEADFPDLPLVLPDLPWQPSAMQLFMFSAATWNRHRIHYERDAARAEGHGDVVAQRALIGNVFARHALGWPLGWPGSGMRLQHLGWRVLASALPGQRLRCQGAVTGRTTQRIPHGLTDRVEPPDNLHAAHTVPTPQTSQTSETSPTARTANSARTGHSANPGALPWPADGQGTWLRYEARLTRLNDGVDIALAEGTLCIPATR
jgi:hypothetical protein